MWTTSVGFELPMVRILNTDLNKLTNFVKFSLRELVKEGKTGMVFSNSAELAKLLIKWFRGYPKDKLQQDGHSKFRDNILNWACLRWDQNWKTSAAAIFMYDE
jgi:hypothetical protein